METNQRNFESFNVELVDDVLINIFELLSVEERKPARLVCWSWNRILTQPHFTSQNWFVLENCLISEKCPPWTTIRNMTEPITNLVLGANIRYDESDEKIDQKEKFFKEIAPHVVRLCITDRYEQFPMHLFTAVKELRYDYVQPEVCFTTVQGQTPCPIPLHPTVVPETVEVLCIKGIHWTTDAGWFDSLRATKKNLKVLRITTIAVPKDNTGCFKMETELKDLADDLYGGYADNQVIVYANVDPNINFLDSSLILDLPDIVKLKRPRYIIHETLSKYKSDLLCMINLKRIHVKLSRDDNPYCFFLHDPHISLPSIRSVKITPSYPYKSNKNLCTECLENFANSCPFIEELSIYSLRAPHTDLLLDAFKNTLTKVKLDFNCDTNLPVMHRLRSVQFRRYSNKNASNLSSQFKKIPNIVEAGFRSYDWNFGVAELKAVGKCWRQLKCLEIRLKPDLAEANVAQTLQKYCRNLVQFVGYRFTNKDVVLDTFAKMPMLQVLPFQNDYCKRKYLTELSKML